MNTCTCTTTYRNVPSAGEFDDLISALRTGDVFGDDIVKLRRVRKRNNNNNNYGSHVKVESRERVVEIAAH